MGENIPMTISGKQRLEEELKRLLQEERPAVIRAIEEARGHGDLSENAEYDAAKERQSLIEGKINEIQNRLAGASVIDTSRIKSTNIVFGAFVKLEDIDNGDKVVYQIVGPEEADVSAGKVSVLSPLSRALIGKKSGDVVLVRTPKLEKEYEVLDFHFE